MNLAVIDSKGPMWRKERTKQAVHKISKMLMSAQRCSELTICVDYVHRVTTEHNRGSCRAYRDDPSKHARRFNIKLTNSMPWSDTVVILAHELVHVMQYASGKLQNKTGSGKLVAWKAGPWELIEDIAYEDRPWEWEALKRQQDLADAYFKVEEPNWVF